MVEPECVLLIGREGADHVWLTIFPLLDDPTNNPYAARPADIRLRAGPFSGAYSTDLRPQELHTFLAELRSLYDCLSGTATLANLEGTLRLLFTGNGSGAIALSGHFNDDLHHDCRLEIALSLDQSYLLPVLTAAGSLAEFPGD